MLLLSDPAVAAVPVVECGEGLVDLRAFAEFQVDERKRDDAGAYAWLRGGVAERLRRAQAALPGDLALLIVEGYRPPALQSRYFEAHREELRRLHPEWPENRLRTEASMYVAPPDVAPHPCGAAVDLTLCTQRGEELDMGTAINASPQDSAGACFTAADTIQPAARALRRVLGEALSAAGLVNYPTEWWRWAYGDRYWAVVTGAGTAVYGPIG